MLRRGPRQGEPLYLSCQRGPTISGGRGGRQSGQSAGQEIGGAGGAAGQVARMVEVIDGGSPEEAEPLELPLKLLPDVLPLELPPDVLPGTVV